MRARDTDNTFRFVISTGSQGQGGFKATGYARNITALTFSAFMLS